MFPLSESGVLCCPGLVDRIMTLPLKGRFRTSTVLKAPQIFVSQARWLPHTSRKKWTKRRHLFRESLYFPSNPKAGGLWKMVVWGSITLISDLGSGGNGNLMITAKEASHRRFSSPIQPFETWATFSTAFRRWYNHHGFRFFCLGVST